MADEKYPGRIEISPHAIATIAGEAVLRCYGVVGVASKNLIGGIADLLQPDRWGRGVDVLVRDGKGQKDRVTPLPRRLAELPTRD